MNHEPSTLDFGALWRNQPIAELRISLEEIQERATRSGRRMRRGAVLFATTVALHVAVNVLKHFIEQSEFRGWIAILEFTTLVILLAYWPYQIARNAQWPLSVVPAREPVPGLEFYRKELGNRRRFATDTGTTVRLLIVSGAFLSTSFATPH